ncbi:MAG: hypothetical protein JWP06_1151 [Candidatus Saccharibacteria bacterium]|nr:hypothetical protein [Candidatus Saccharibacteria bacterium]
MPHQWFVFDEAHSGALSCYDISMNTPSAISHECPLCPQNNLLIEPIIAQTPDAYLIKAYSNPGNYLIIPTAHIESLETLPPNWWKSVSTLLPQVPHGQSYNMSINIGSDAGQTVRHIHFWIIPREAGKPSSSKGLARLISEADASTS